MNLRSTRPSYRQWLAILLLVAFAVRLAAGWAWQSRLDGRRFGMGDSESYWSLGLAIAAGGPYEFGADHARAFRTPGYPVLLAPILLIFGDDQNAVVWARAEAAVFGVLAVAGVWWLGRLLFDDRTALLAAVMATFYPGAIVLSALVLSEAPFCPLMLLNIGLWIKAWQAGDRRRRTAGFAFAAGLAAGAATLMRPSWLLFAPLAGALAILLGPRRFRHLQIAAWMTLGLAVGMGPWWIRNACVVGQFVPTTLQVGASLYDGLNPQADGGSNMDFVPAATEQERNRRPTNDEPFEARLDRRMRQAALAWARANPGRTIELASVKLRRLWNVWPNEPQLSSWPIRLVVFLTYVPVLFCAIIGGWRTLGRGWPYILCWLPAVYFTMLHTVFVSSIRYREPAMLALLALAAGGIVGGIRDWGLGIRDERPARLGNRRNLSNS